MKNLVIALTFMFGVGLIGADAMACGHNSKATSEGEKTEVQKVSSEKAADKKACGSKAEKASDKKNCGSKARSTSVKAEADKKECGSKSKAEADKKDEDSKSKSEKSTADASDDDE